MDDSLAQRWQLRRRWQPLKPLRHHRRRCRRHYRRRRRPCLLQRRMYDPQATMRLKESQPLISTAGYRLEQVVVEVQAEQDMSRPAEDRRQCHTETF